MRNESGIAYESISDVAELNVIWHRVVNCLPVEALLALNAKRLAIVLQSLELTRDQLVSLLTMIASDSNLNSVFADINPDPSQYDHETQFEHALKAYILQSYFNLQS